MFSLDDNKNTSICIAQNCTSMSYDVTANLFEYFFIHFNIKMVLFLSIKIPPMVSHTIGGCFLYVRFYGLALVIDFI